MASRGRYRQPGTQARFQHEAQLGSTFLAHAPRHDARAPGEQALAAQVLLHVPAKVIVPQFVQCAHGAAEPREAAPRIGAARLVQRRREHLPRGKGIARDGPVVEAAQNERHGPPKPTSTLRARAVSLRSEIYTGDRYTAVKIELEKQKRDKEALVLCRIEDVDVSR